MTWSSVLLRATRMTTEKARLSLHDTNSAFCPTVRSAKGTSTTGSRPAFPSALPGWRYITASGAWFTRTLAVNGQCSRATTGSSIMTHAICSWYSRPLAPFAASLRSSSYCSEVSVNGRCSVCWFPLPERTSRVGAITTPGVEASLGASAAAQNGSHASTRAHAPGSGGACACACAVTDRGSLHGSCEACEGCRRFSPLP